jgi:hypothetical protein
VEISLREELETAPYAGMDAAQMLAAVNVLSVPTSERQLVPLWKIKKLCVETGVWVGMKMATIQTQSADLANVATLAMEYINDTRFENLDMDLVSTQEMIAWLVLGTVMTQGQADIIDGMADVKTSRAIQILGREANDVDIREATRPLI